MKTKAVSHIFTACLAAVFVLCLANSAEIAAQSAYYLRLCAVRVVPSLFVFSVLCSVICSSPLFYGLCSLPFFGTEAAVLLMGVLGGFPLGASAATELYDSGALTKRQAEYLCSFTNNPSLSFVISYAGGILESRRTGLILALLTVASAVLTALIFRFVFLKKGERALAARPSAARPKSFARAVSDGCLTMLTVSGCIVFFGGISVLFPSWLRGFLELSGGISAVKDPISAAVLLGFSGLSVFLQVYAVCAEKLSVKPFIAAKITQSAIMGVFAYFVFDYAV